MLWLFIGCYWESEIDVVYRSHHSSTVRRRVARDDCAFHAQTLEPVPTARSSGYTLREKKHRYGPVILCVCAPGKRIGVERLVSPNAIRSRRFLAPFPLAVIGAGGPLGALTFGFLQRACSLYGTGLGKVRTLGATSDTATQLNRVLGKQFVLAFADESVIKLTNLQSVEALQDRFEGWNAVVWGTDVVLKTRPVTANTFETTPNDKTVELYWDADGKAGDVQTGNADEVKRSILSNVLQASRTAKLQHMVVVDDGSIPNLLEQLADCGTPYTCIRPTGPLESRQDYTFRKGVQGDLRITKLATFSATLSPRTDTPIPREDVAALCVECLQSLDWSQSRCLQVSCVGALDLPAGASGKRSDQEWCVNTFVLRDRLVGIDRKDPDEIVQPVLS
jgi:hypothetical protein